jgi:hypothetical protein
MDRVLVWVDPLHEGKTRATLDPLLRDVSARGPWVSAHPDVILKMDLKEVLHRAKHLYRSAEVFREEFSGRLRTSGPQVLEQNRANGGQGVWKVELIDSLPGGDMAVRVLHARRGSVPEELALADFMTRCEEYFTPSVVRDVQRRIMVRASHERAQLRAADASAGGEKRQARLMTIAALTSAASGGTWTAPFGAQS